MMIIIIKQQLSAELLTYFLSTTILLLLLLMLPQIIILRYDLCHLNMSQLLILLYYLDKIIRQPCLIREATRTEKTTNLTKLLRAKATQIHQETYQYSTSTLTGAILVKKLSIVITNFISLSTSVVVRKRTWETTLLPFTQEP